jgi:hypothetical protein
MGGPVKFNGVVIFAFVSRKSDNEVGVRVSTDDWERLGLFPGQQVRVQGASVDSNFLLASVTEEPPLVWLRFQSLASRVAG